MYKTLGIFSVGAMTLLVASQANSHVLCLPNTLQPTVHTHNQTFTVPRIQPVVSHTASRTIYQNQNQQKHLAAQRARQQKALENQRRINEQRRLQAIKIQQQVAARKAEQIRQQRAAAKRAQAARQRAALQAAKRKAAMARQVTQQATHQQATNTDYVPSPQSVSISINTQSNYHSHNIQPVRPVRQQNLHYPKPANSSGYIVCEPCYQ